MWRTKWKCSIIVVILLTMFSFTNEDEWGFYAHKEINELAIYTLPPDLFGFYKEHLEFIKEHAVDPDKRRYSVIGEAPKHYIDIDYYCHGDPDCDPFALMPRQWNDAVERYTEDTLMAYGTSPWNINLMMYKLTDAFREKNIKRILRLSTELGHYVGDAHVPLHTTENYNGQLTNQKGIHGFWESRIPELFDADYDFFVGRSKYIESPLNKAWETIEHSHNAVDSVLRFGAELNASWPSDKKYIHEERGRALIKTYSREYTAEYQRRLNGQVERRMREAIITIGSLWYTAWVDAGQPDLTPLLEEAAPLDELEQEIAKENSGEVIEKLKQREHGN